MDEWRTRLALFHTTAIIEINEQKLARRKYPGDECNLTATGFLPQRAPKILCMPRRTEKPFPVLRTREDGRRETAKVDPGAVSVSETSVSTRAVKGTIQNRAEYFFG